MANICIYLIEYQWLILTVGIILTCFSFLLMKIIASFLPPPKKRLMLMELQPTFTKKSVKEALKNIDDKKVAKVFIQQLIIDVFFALGIFLILIILIVQTDSNILQNQNFSEKSKLLLLFSFIFLLADWLENWLTLHALKLIIQLNTDSTRKVIYPIGYIWLLKWVAVIITFVLIGISHIH